MSGMKVDTAAMQQAAKAFRKLHKQALEAIAVMKDSRSELSTDWEGPAGEQIQSAYSAFLTKYADRYLQMLDHYAVFLDQIAAKGYAQTEAGNVKMADLIARDIGMCPTDEASGAIGKTKEAVNQWILKLQ